VNVEGRYIYENLNKPITCPVYLNITYQLSRSTSEHTPQNIYEVYAVQNIYMRYIEILSIYVNVRNMGTISPMESGFGDQGREHPIITVEFGPPPLDSSTH
jgi:hypothetical protein